jgi:hypothetical protein
MVAPAVTDATTTFCTAVYVPEGTLNVGVPTFQT